MKQEVGGKKLKEEEEKNECSRDFYMFKSHTTPKFDLNKLPQDERELQEFQQNKETERSMIIYMLKIYLPKSF